MSGFGIWAFGFRVSGFGIYGEPRQARVHSATVQAFRFQGLGFRFRVQALGFRFRVQGAGFRFPGFRFRIPGLRFLVQGFGLLVSGFCLRVSGFWFRVSGFWFRIHGFEKQYSIARTPSEAEGAGQKNHRGTSLIRNRPALAPFCRFMSRAQWWS